MLQLLILLAFLVPATLSMTVEGSTARASKSAPIVATLGERASAFANLAGCEAALVPGVAAKGLLGQTQIGSAFNPARGNFSRCEMSAGEPMIIVIPREARGPFGG